MGLYPTYEIVTRAAAPDGGETWNEKRIEPGVTYVRPVSAGPWAVLERTNCFCCSCQEDDDGHVTNDPYCRNHGWAGTRPCEKHDMPGDTDEEGKPLASVQAIRTG